MTNPIRGAAWRFGDDIDTDVIISSEHMRKDPEEYARYTMNPVDPEFSETVEQGDIIVAERNFGIGSSREQAAIALKKTGIEAIVAESFGRIFYRNAINQGLLAVSANLEHIQTIDDGDEIEIHPADGTIENCTTDNRFEFDDIDEPIKSIYEAGGAKRYYGQLSDE